MILQERKSCNKSVKRHCYFSTQKYDDSITRYFPLSKKEFQNNLHGKFSGSYLDYTIFICKFATEEKWFWQLEPFSKLKQLSVNTDHQLKVTWPKCQNKNPRWGQYEQVFGMWGRNSNSPPPIHVLLLFGKPRS